MSPVSRKRKKKPGRRRTEPTPGQVYARVLNEYVDVDEALDAELLTADLLGAWWREHAAEARTRGLIGYAARQHRSEALGLLSCLSLLGTEPAMRQGAADAARRLADAGVARPAWVAGLGPVTTRRCLRSTDVFGEQSTVFCDFERGGARHALVAEIGHDPVDGELLALSVADDPDTLLAELSNTTDDEVEHSFVEVPAEEAAGLLRTGLVLLDEAPEELDDEDDDDALLVSTRALAMSRARDMPGEAVLEPPEPPAPSDAELAAMLDEFLAAPEAAGLAGDENARGAAMVILGWGLSEDGRPLRIGPGRLDRMLHGLPLADAMPERVAAEFPRVVVAWARYAGRRAGLPDDAVGALAEMADECGDHVTDPEYVPGGEARHHPWSAESGDEEVDPVDADAVLDRYLPELREADNADRLPAPEDLPDLLARRMFALPELSVTVDGEFYPDLDPSDPDERRLLIVGEHPEYAGVWRGDAPEQIDGVNPRLHIAAHEMVAAQLWDDDPAEVWQAAQRLLELGMERMEVLHALGSVAMEQVRHGLTGGTPDPADYAAALAALGR